MSDRATILAALINLKHKSNSEQKHYDRLADEAVRYEKSLATVEDRENSAKILVEKKDENVNVSQSVKTAIEQIKAVTAHDITWYNTTKPAARNYEPDRVKLYRIGTVVRELEKKLGL